ncbi:DUF4277 domain-containing protein [Streptomyces sp. 1114.5]|uniref:DUF4277 domain-containing protein n=1 Tax=Streptomyces sp. 1114.5 TaxID=1938830 RepID=UPI00217DFDC5|nr:DUF4277 domain-containing protein [Streptomyces sp. 1114.5]
MVEKRLGALPVAAEFLRRLDVSGIVDGLCPSAPSAHLTHGQVIEALVANRLTSPMPLFRVGDWARVWAVEEVFGIEPALLDDDLLARALDAIAPHLEQVAGTVGARDPGAGRDLLGRLVVLAARGAGERVDHRPAEGRSGPSHRIPGRLDPAQCLERCCPLVAAALQPRHVLRPAQAPLRRAHLLDTTVPRTLRP